MKKYWKLAILIAIVIFTSFYFFKNRNPFPDVEWIEDSPGATERFVTFTPVLKSNNKIVVGPTEGADYAKLRFEDINNDGIKEAIIETNVPFLGQAYSSERHILEYRKTTNGQPEFVLIKSEKLDE
jgi:hypothetical protein